MSRTEKGHRTVEKRFFYLTKRGIRERGGTPVRETASEGVIRALRERRERKPETAADFVRQIREALARQQLRARSRFRYRSLKEIKQKFKSLLSGD